MEIHSVLPEERARDHNGDPLPWGYRYADSARNVRQPEESGPFGRNRSIRLTSSRTPRARTGTTPVRQKENTAVAEFGRLLAKDLSKEEERTKTTLTSSTTPGDAARSIEPEAVPTECLLYGYAGKASEWKVLSKFEQIVAPGYICEDYPREDPQYLMASNSPLGLSGSSVAVHENLSREAIRKSRIYIGGQNWIKVTFDSYQAADRACYFSPIEIDGHLVHCEMWQGRGPGADVPVPAGPKGADKASLLATDSGRKARTLSVASGKDSALAGFERALQTLPRSHIMADVQYGQPTIPEDESAISSNTASSATATEITPTPSSGLRSRSVPQLPSQELQKVSSNSEYMTHIKVKKAVLRPVSEALPPQPTFAEKIFRSIPIVTWFVGSNKQGAAGGDIIGEGPLLKEDGTWDSANGWYWSFWHSVDKWAGTDFCGLTDD
ncbi:hypothetical protein EDD36DRAFT_13563 [Exophiala viscosa]|uniref:Uncharacterized protein n=1 Tax=Exophiala viscosa TaxID=2486360 RepID=A0AAN6IHN3_9EURO|nr:hypothetical protein EDD36DRAFT_13563 [Exophiala viscosa]